MAFIQVPPDSTGKLVDTTLVSGQHRENIIIGDPTTAAALGSVVRTPNADLPAGNPGGAGGVVTMLNPVTSYAPAVAGHDGLYGKVLLTDPMGRVRTVAGGELLELMFAELQKISALLEILNEPYGSIPDAA